MTWTALLPLLGGVVGAILTYLFSRSMESKKHLQLVQSQSYADYLRSVTKLAHFSSPGDRKSALTDATDAKARMAIYGSSSAIEALARFEEAGPALDNERSIDLFLALVHAMRQDSSATAARDLRLVLFGKATGRPSPGVRAGTEAGDQLRN